jgi:hypothetical protein
MPVELCCPVCSCSFAAPPEMTSENVMQKMNYDGSWYALGDGETFEDMIFSSLAENGDIACPNCGALVSVSEESIGQMALELLAQW